MKVLILGGREFLGKHIVESFLSKDHEVTLFNRCRTNPDWFSDLETIKGDREKDLDLLKERRWDVVVDTCGYLPKNLEEVAKTLSENVDHYIFISSCSVYDQFPKERVLDEKAQIVNLDLDWDNLEPMGKDYGACKFLSERAIDNNFKGKITHLRPGLIVGPYDTTARFPYWVKRLAEGGEVLAPSTPDSGTQLIDARDLANWCVEIAQKGITGEYNATGERTRLGDVLETMAATFDMASTLHWIPEDFLKANEVRCWTELPLWVFKEVEVFVNWDSSKAMENGLNFRSLEETTRDTYNWLKDADFNSLKFEPMTEVREKELLSKYSGLFETERTIVREFREGDADEAFIFYSDPEVMKFIGKGDTHISENQKDEVIQRRQKYYREHPGLGIWAVIEKETGMLIGHTALIELNNNGVTEVEVAYLLRKDKWGKGFATELADATIKYGFDKLDLEKIVAVVYPENKASIKVLEKCQMVTSGKIEYSGLNIPYYSLTKSDLDK
jgi:2'-hydroxyisoflavone reductase